MTYYNPWWSVSLITLFTSIFTPVQQWRFQALRSSLIPLVQLASSFHHSVIFESLEFSHFRSWTKIVAESIKVMPTIWLRNASFSPHHRVLLLPFSASCLSLHISHDLYGIYITLTATILQFLIQNVPRLNNPSMGSFHHRIHYLGSETICPHHKYHWSRLRSGRVRVED